MGAAARLALRLAADAEGRIGDHHQPTRRDIVPAVFTDPVLLALRSLQCVLHLAQIVDEHLPHHGGTLALLLVLSILRKVVAKAWAPRLALIIRQAAQLRTEVVAPGCEPRDGVGPRRRLLVRTIAPLSGIIALGLCGHRRFLSRCARQMQAATRLDEWLGIRAEDKRTNRASRL